MHPLACEIKRKTWWWSICTAVTTPRHETRSPDGILVLPGRYLYANKPPLRNRLVMLSYWLCTGLYVLRSSCFCDANSSLLKRVLWWLLLGAGNKSGGQGIKVMCRKRHPFFYDFALRLVRSANSCEGSCRLLSFCFFFLSSFSSSSLSSSPPFSQY